MNVADGLLVESITLAGENVPPAPLSDSVTVIGTAVVPAGARATVNGSDATLGALPTGPVRLRCVAG